MKVTTPTTAHKKSLAFKALTTVRRYCLNKVNSTKWTTKWTQILSCITATVAVYVNSNPNLCILRPSYCLNKVNVNPKLQNSRCCSVCKLRPKSVYTQTQLCINSDPHLCILRPNFVSAQTQICVYSDPTLYQLRPKSVQTQSSGPVWKPKWMSWAPHLHNSPYGLWDVKQHLKREKKICIGKLRNVQRLYTQDKLALQSVPNTLFSIWGHEARR